MSSTGAIDPNAVNNVSTETFTTSLVTNLAIFAIEVGVFVLLFRQFPQIYEPRSFMPAAKRKRSEPLPRSILAWALEIWRADERRIMITNGLDAYSFYRYLKLMIHVFLWVPLICPMRLMPSKRAMGRHLGPSAASVWHGTRWQSGPLHVHLWQ
jgi:hypothetical protein